MTQLRTTFDHFSGAPRQTLPWMTERELSAVHAAVDDGTLGVAVIDTDAGGVIVAIATADLAEEVTKRDDDVIGHLLDALTDARNELKSLREIVGETFSEKEPVDYRYRIDEAINDVAGEISYAASIAEMM